MPGKLKDMAIVLPEREFTLDDVASMAAADGSRRYEVANGLLSIMPPDDSQHATIVMRLVGWLLAAGVSPDLLMADAGLRVGGRLGRTPDLIALRATPPTSVWIDPAYVTVVVEVVSDGSEDLDYKIKPAEYAGARIAHFWRVDRSPDINASLVTMYRLDPSVGGYREAAARPLGDLLAGPVPDLTA